MLIKQVFIEIKRFYTKRNLLMILAFLLIIPLISLFSIRTGYVYPSPLDAFQNAISIIIPILFPALVVSIYLPSFLLEQKTNFLFFTRTRVPLSIYIISKAITNSLIVGTTIFVMIFSQFLFINYVDPYIGIIDYTQGSNFLSQNPSSNQVTFSQFLKYGDFTYGLIYSIWVSLNAVIYATIAFISMLIARSGFVALSLPFLFYHIFNFITGVLGVARFSPISTIFPFNIKLQPLWTVLVPFSILILILIILVSFAKKQEENWVK